MSSLQPALHALANTPTSPPMCLHPCRCVYALADVSTPSPMCLRTATGANFYFNSDSRMIRRFRVKHTLTQWFLQNPAMYTSAAPPRPPVVASHPKPPVVIPLTAPRPGYAAPVAALNLSQPAKAAAPNGRLPPAHMRINVPPANVFIPNHNMSPRSPISVPSTSSPPTANDTDHSCVRSSPKVSRPV
jgi:hypothetical protein